MILGFIQIAWVLSVLIMIFLKPKYSLALYLAYVMLVPYLNIRIVGIEMHWNFVNIIMLFGICFFLNKKEHFHFDIKPFVPFIIYYVISLIIMLFQDGVPFAGRERIISASRTRQPPTMMLTVSFSDRKTTDENTVTTGSNVEASAAVDAPVFSMPVRNDQKARTVEIIASRNTAV